MRASPQVPVSWAAKRELASFCAASLVLAWSTPLPAATPVDIYQSMESGNAGDLLTSAIMNASSYGGGTGWSLYTGSSLWVSNSYATNLPGPVVVAGTTYPGTNATRTWVFNNNNCNDYTQVGISSTGYSEITVAGYYTTQLTIYQTLEYDLVVLHGNETFAVMQQINDVHNNTTQYLRAHSNTNPGQVTTYGSTIPIAPGKTYWFNLKYDSAGAAASVAVFDPANSFAQVGSTSVANSTAGDKMAYTIEFGRCDNHGNEPADTSQAWFGQILVDYTNAAFPLIPSGGTDTPTALRPFTTEPPPAWKPPTPR